MYNKIFEGLIELENEFASGNDIQHNTKTNIVYRTPRYKAYKQELIDAIDELNDKFNVQISQGTPIGIYLTFYQTNVNQTTRATKDLDNMEKPTLDALQEALGFDDSQIVTKLSKKKSHFTRALRVEIWLL
ncbi:Holliday junction resolvase RusA-like endonuclease [Weissella uvarum]|uniref:RusA family crossover junction endodeoxyribonuclease n=1 Tax=Weissella uvarum TaxID=1479233 RepID=UPI0019620419|nr:RusA family crossover junction endodeoxyribonuclease [Weissella uvarum]MBM7616701.1 Holliday junction resolvase RusA-like endonuclease [Weissella uvarum]MCM0594844.1 RusA family crossover junction endodeoxyribonuclease [Weissella uvarum]